MKSFAFFTCLFVLITNSIFSARDQQASVPEIKSLLKQALNRNFTSNREVLMDVVTVPPNTVMDWHWHPGEEFNYVLAGEATVFIKGKSPLVMKEGMVGHIPFEIEHKVQASDKGITVLVFRVHTTGKPVRYDGFKPSG